MVQLAKKNGKYGFVMTSVNAEGIKKRKFITLRKIAIKRLLPIGLAVGVFTTGYHAGKYVMENYKNQDEKNLEALANLDENEKFVEEQLANYSITLSDYNDAVEHQNSNEHYIVEKRVELISATRDLNKVVDNLVQVKVLEGLGIEDPECTVEVSRIKNGASAEPTDVLTVTKDEEVIYNSNHLPKELTSILNLKEELKQYEGNGENIKWSEDIDNFIKKGNNLYDTILNLTTKDFVNENGSLKSEVSTKGM